MAQLDLVIRGGTVVDGTGVPRYQADKNLEDRTEDGSALPSHVASPEEFLALADVLSEFGVGHLGWTIGISTTALEQQRLLTEMMRRSGRPLHVAVGDDEQGFAWAKEARDAGLPVVVQQNSMDPDTATCRGRPLRRIISVRRRCSRAVVEIPMVQPR